MVSVAHVAERVIVAHEAAGSIPVGHPSQTARSSLGRARSSEDRGREFESLRAGQLLSL